MPDTVVTRFAPSPTGFLHIGGGRTALFNWLYARHFGGKMLLRIEDTDRERSTEAAVQAILDGLRWLGIEWDGEPVYQFQRMDRHAALARRLLEEGKAYRCYATRDELDEMRTTARAEGRSRLYSGLWRDRDPADAPPGVPATVRIKVPLEGETVIDDQVQGEVVFANKDLDDFVILRSDGTPTYMLSVVVDDHDMGVTHVIRGDDHLTNAGRQSILYGALGWQPPVMAHIPLIHGPDGAKLSKRHGALGVDAYQALGYLPEAMRNYLVRLGWSHGDDEIISTDQMIEWFNVDTIGRGAARFDQAKLDSLNAHYMRAKSDSALLDVFAAALPFMPGGSKIAEHVGPEMRERLLIAMPELKERAKTLQELLEQAEFIFAVRPIAPDEKAAVLLDGEARATLGAVATLLESLDTWTVKVTEATIRDFAEAKGLKLGKIAQPLRAALTGRTTSPGIFEVLIILGRSESIARIRDQAV